MKPTDINMETFIKYGVEYKDKDHKIKVDDHVKISKHKNILAKSYVKIGLRISFDQESKKHCTMLIRY